MIIIIYTLTAIAVLLAASWWLTRWADRSWDRHWATINTLLCCDCGDPHEVTVSHSPRGCVTK